MQYYGEYESFDGAMNEFRLRKKELELQNQRLALGQAYEELEKIINKSKNSYGASAIATTPLS